MAIKKEIPEVEKTKIETEEEKTYCYIGPNLPDGALKKNTVLIGTKTAIKDRYKEEIEKYPQIPNLIVPVEKLAEAKEKAETEGNILNKYYADINSTVAANNENRG